MPAPGGPLSWVLRNTRNQSIGNRIRDGIAFGTRVVWWAKNPVTIATILRHSTDGITWIDTADIDGGNSDNPQRVDQLTLIGDGFLYLIADPGVDAGMGVWRTSDLVTITQRYASLSTRVDQYGGIGVIPASDIAPCRTEVLAAPVENPLMFRDNGVAWEARPALPTAATITAYEPETDWIIVAQDTALAQGAALQRFDIISLSWNTVHTALATIHRLRWWPGQSVTVYARFAQGAEPANTSRIYSVASDGTATERYAGQFTGIVSDFIVEENDLYFSTVDGQPTGANVRIYRVTGLTSTPIPIGTITPANPALDSSAFLVWHPGMQSFFVTLQTLAGPARQEVYQASLSAPSASKRLRMGMSLTPGRRKRELGIQ